MHRTAARKVDPNVMPSFKITASELRSKYLAFFGERAHVTLPSASLVPTNDPTVLFTTAGMHPLVPYLLGEPHPAGMRLVNVQKCVRTGDIDVVGDDIAPDVLRDDGELVARRLLPRGKHSLEL